MSYEATYYLPINKCPVLVASHVRDEDEDTIEITIAFTAEGDYFRGDLYNPPEIPEVALEGIYYGEIEIPQEHHEEILEAMPGWLEICEGVMTDWDSNYEPDCYDDSDWM